MATPRFTANDLDAIHYAVVTVLAGPLDGIDEDTQEYRKMHRQLERVLRVVGEHLDGEGTGPGVTAG